MYLMRRLIHGPMCPSTDRVDGKTIIVTGANCGIGKETARELALRGGRVIMACRDVTKGREAAAEIEQTLQQRGSSASYDSKVVGSVLVKPLDLSSLESVRRFAEDIVETEPRVDILINNAGLMLSPEAKTKEGYEMQLGVNHLGHFLLTNLLLDRIVRSAPSRIITVSSRAHRFGKMDFEDINYEKKKYSPTGAYSQSKFANLLFTHQLAKKLQGTGVTVYALHPGVVRTDLFRHSGNTLSVVIPWLVSSIGGVFMKTAVEGAQTTIYCAVTDQLKNESGLYYSDCKVTKPLSSATDDVAASRLWDLSCAFTGFEDKS